MFGIVGHTHSSAIMSRSGEGQLPGCSVLASLCPVLKRTVDAMLSNFPGFVTICSEQDVMSLCKQIVLFAYLLFTGTERWHKQVFYLLFLERRKLICSPVLSRLGVFICLGFDDQPFHQSPIHKTHCTVAL